MKVQYVQKEIVAEDNHGHVDQIVGDEYGGQKFLGSGKQFLDEPVARRFAFKLL